MTDSAQTRWTASQAAAWYENLPWLVGCNYTPAYAGNQLEMWQPETFDIDAIARELDLAASIGFNTVRVFLHDLCFDADPTGFVSRIDRFLDVASKRGIHTMPVFFDSVWHPYPRPGKQRPPEPHVHNSMWVQSPGVHVLRDAVAFDRLQNYVQTVVSHFRDDARVVIWDLWNEPDNNNHTAYGNRDVAQGKSALVAPLLEKTYAWARAAKPTQPLTTGIWGGVSEKGDTPDSCATLQMNESDVISFHSYTTPDLTEKTVERFEALGRPMLCTEFMARGAGSTFEAILPIFKKHNVGAYCWGFVNGRSQTIYPWDSLTKRYMAEPEVWFHDIFNTDHTAYRTAEVALIRELTGWAPEATVVKPTKRSVATV